MKVALTIGAIGLIAGAGLLLTAWPMINVVETGRTPEYPDLVPRTYRAAPSLVFDATLHAVDRLPRWTLVAHDERRGEIRAEATTRLLRFVDDVTIRVRPCGDATCVEARSASRIGKGDFGQNARNIRRLFEELDRQLTQRSHEEARPERHGESDPTPRSR